MECPCPKSDKIAPGCLLLLCRGTCTSSRGCRSLTRLAGPRLGAVALRPLRRPSRRAPAPRAGGLARPARDQTAVAFSSVHHVTSHTTHVCTPELDLYRDMKTTPLTIADFMFSMFRQAHCDNSSDPVLSAVQNPLTLIMSAERFSTDPSPPTPTTIVSFIFPPTLAK